MFSLNISIEDPMTFSDFQFGFRCFFEASTTAANLDAGSCIRFYMHHHDVKGSCTYYVITNGGGSLQMITVLHRRGSSQTVLVTVLHRGVLAK